VLEFNHRSNASRKRRRRIRDRTLETGANQKCCHPNSSSINQQKIAVLVRQSHEARKKAKELLEEAKRKVEEMIEKGDEK